MGKKPEWELTEDEIYDCGSGRSLHNLKKMCQKQARKLVEWGDGDCPHKCGWRKRECRKCWQQLRQQVGE